MHRLRYKTDSRVEFLNRELAEDHRWGTKDLEDPSAEDGEELVLPDESFSESEASDEEGSLKQVTCDLQGSQLLHHHIISHHLKMQNRRFQ